MLGWVRRRGGSRGLRLLFEDVFFSYGIDEWMVGEMRIPWLIRGSRITMILNRSIMNDAFFSLK